MPNRYQKSCRGLITREEITMLAMKVSLEARFMTKSHTMGFWPRCVNIGDKQIARGGVTAFIQTTVTSVLSCSEAFNTECTSCKTRQCKIDPESTHDTHTFNTVSKVKVHCKYIKLSENVKSRLTCEKIQFQIII